MIQLTDAKKPSAIETQLKDSGISDDTAYWIAVGLEVAKLAVTAGLTLYLTYKIQDILKSLLDPMNEASASAIVTKKALAKRLQRPEIEDMEFDSYEMGLLNEILGPGEIKESFQDIGGMEAQLEEVKDNIVLPMQLWTRFRKIGVLSAEEEELSTCPTGMLLYGQPGTGKSLTAKAVAKGECSSYMACSISRTSAAVASLVLPLNF
jgi:SpoVK/Ycf46/Vps4 family AAA+-type ATPase